MQRLRGHSAARTGCSVSAGRATTGMVGRTPLLCVRLGLYVQLPNAPRAYRSVWCVFLHDAACCVKMRCVRAAKFCAASADADACASMHSLRAGARARSRRRAVCGVTAAGALVVWDVPSRAATRTIEAAVDGACAGLERLDG